MESGNEARILHKKWPLTRSTTKMVIGQFYIAIDMNLQAKGSRPDNTYRFIERVVTSNHPRCTLMIYGVENVELKALRTELKE